MTGRQRELADGSESKPTVRGEQAGRSFSAGQLCLFVLIVVRPRRPMPDKSTIERAQRDKREGKAPTTQAGEFVREEMHHIREGKHGARSAKQAIAIGLSKARQAGVDLPPPGKGEASERTRKSAERAYERRSEERRV